MLSRRGFLGLFAGAAAHKAGRKFFFAPIGGWKSDVIVNPVLAGNAFFTSTWISRQALAVLLSNLELSQNLNRSYDQEFSCDLAIGQKVNIRKPIRFHEGSLSA